MVKMFEIEVPITGREVYIVEAETFEEAKGYILGGDIEPNNSEVHWADDFEVVDEWEEN